MKMNNYPQHQRLSSATDSFPIHQEFRLIYRGDQQGVDEAEVKSESAFDFEAEYQELLHDLQGLEIIDDMRHAGDDSAK